MTGEGTEMAKQLSEKQMKKVMKREKSRKTAMGIGAVFGTITSLAISWILLGKSIVEHDEK